MSWRNSSQRSGRGISSRLGLFTSRGGGGGRGRRADLRNRLSGQQSSDSSNSPMRNFRIEADMSDVREDFTVSRRNNVLPSRLQGFRTVVNDQYESSDFDFDAGNIVRRTDLSGLKRARFRRPYQSSRDLPPVRLNRNRGGGRVAGSRRPPQPNPNLANATQVLLRALEQSISRESGSPRSGGGAGRAANNNPGARVRLQRNRGGAPGSMAGRVGPRLPKTAPNPRAISWVRNQGPPPVRIARSFTNSAAASRFAGAGSQDPEDLPMDVEDEDGTEMAADRPSTSAKMRLGSTGARPMGSAIDNRDEKPAWIRPSTWAAMGRGPAADPRTASSSTTKHRVIVTNLAREVTEFDLKDLFSMVGPVAGVKTLGPGKCELTFTSEKQATTSVRLFNGREFEGKKMTVTLVPQTSAGKQSRIEITPSGAIKLKRNVAAAPIEPSPNPDRDLINQVMFRGKPGIKTEPSQPVTFTVKV